ncbi:PPR domain-containing protein/PPR_1 domain-containing protein/PPR_2 domain-containing protein/PPR_3 domain-containing protein [Cephalotus follicularis]|uniref:PPR domain-containing protein/PPR_1 domain-containing protein/PPR_2 domain-containing protein/PPR_3 domain-containing protein n=1 Tax=Cephalotus follicularis TaxID=3775 RepID=A0A1Q3APJ7_CEPFO|nr:PPR domain-containing protein/PPR_1 domain-containing protein/PPR_2 domain-containing protein/PPR_3 domain-containing protein [Cephalotus follicularis]
MQGFSSKRKTLVRLNKKHHLLSLLSGPKTILNLTHAQQHRYFNTNNHDGINVVPKHGFNLICAVDTKQDNNVTNDDTTTNNNHEFATDVEKLYRILRRFHSRVPKLELALQESGVVLGPGLTERVLNRCGDAGNLGYRFFVWASKQPDYSHSYDVYKAMIKSLSKMRQFGAVWALLEEMRKENHEFISPELFVVLIRRFASTRMVKKAVEVLEEMPKYGCEPDEYVFGCLLDALCKNGSVKDAAKLFEEMRDRFKPTLRHFTSLLYGWCREGKLMEAKYVLVQMREAGFEPDIVVYNNLLSGYAKEGRMADAFDLLKEMRRKGCDPNANSYTVLIQALCGMEKMEEAMRVFVEMGRSGCEADIVTYTALISGFCNTKLGDVGYACEVFAKIPSKELAVWNAMITGCVENRFEDIGIVLFREMHLLGVRHDKYSLASVLSVCYEELMDFGRQVHSLVIKTGFLVRSSVVNSLITMYFNCGKVVDAHTVFEEAERFVYDQITYNVMIDGLVCIGRVEEALVMFKEMLEADLRPTELTFVSLMSSCSDSRMGYQIHAKVIQTGFESCTSVSNATMTMFSSCGDLDATQRTFERMEEKDLVSWNTMISSYGQGNFGESAVLTFMEMQMAGIDPDAFTFGSLLASLEFIETMQMIHTLVLTNGLISNIHISNALVSAYSKHGKLEEAYQIFYGLSSRNLISWNTIISGFLLNGCPVQGLEQFSRLMISELKPNAYTLSIALSISASISSLRHGKQINGYILRHGFFSETSIGNALITMYAKCGVLDWSLRVFNQMMYKDTVSWNALISAYAQHGKGKEAVCCFEAMKDAGSINLDQATFTAVLSACSHAGLVNDGTQIFNSMVKDYRFKPRDDHFSCMVDLLDRAGYLDEAKSVIYSEEIEAHSSVWWTLFSACAAHGNVSLGRMVADFLLETEQNDPSVYVLLSNLYATAGQWEEAASTREVLKKIGVMKQPGCSWIGP